MLKRLILWLFDERSIVFCGRMLALAVFVQISIQLIELAIATPMLRVMLLSAGGGLLTLSLGAMLKTTMAYLSFPAGKKLA